MRHLTFAYAMLCSEAAAAIAVNIQRPEDAQKQHSQSKGHSELSPPLLPRPNSSSLYTAYPSSVRLRDLPVDTAQHSTAQHHTAHH
jgi:hypothetical protein